MKKKILFVTNHFRYSNGVASVLRNLIANLDEDKYDISLLALYDFNKDFAEPILKKITVVPGFGGYIRGFDKIVNIIPPRMLYKKFVKGKYDLEIAFQFGVPTKMIAVSPNTHKICWMHTYDSKMKLKKYYKKFPQMITVSKSVLNKLIAEDFDKNKCDYCYNIIDEDLLLESKEEPCDYEKKHEYSIITVGRLAPDKAFMRYLECIKTVVDKAKNVEFLIVGGGVEEERMRKFIKDNRLEEFVIMTGRQTNPYKFMKKADLYFCCSYREGFSTTCQEAALLGVPVASVDVDGAKELNEQVDAGCVIKNDAQSIVDFLLGIAEDKTIIAQWKNIAQSRKQSFYKTERIKKIESLIDRNIE